MSEASESKPAIEPIAAKEFQEARDLEAWRVVGEGACAYFRTGSFAAGARLVQAIGELSGLEDHHPDVDLRYGGVTVRLITLQPGYYGLSKRDLELAREISAVAEKLGLPADPSGLQNIQISIDSAVGPEVHPFWRTVLGYRDRGDDPGELIDPRARGPIAYCQHISASHPRKSQIHLDIWVADDQVEPRLRAAIAAGGRVVNVGRSWTTLEDSQGNRVCVCSWKAKVGSD